MRTIWRQSVLFAVVVLSGFVAEGWAQEPPDDDTTAVPAVRDGDKQPFGEAEQDDPTARLEWERKAWGVVTPSFRQRAVREGRRHGDRKNSRGPKWVSIGPAGADYEQNGSFTGHVRDSGRVRTILPHPWNPNIVYVLTSGGGLWRTDNWQAKDTDWEVLTDDLPTTGGALAFKGFVPSYDATLTKHLRDAGAIVIAKTNMTELANWIATGMPGNYSAVAGYDLTADERAASSAGSTADASVTRTTVGALAPAGNDREISACPCTDSTSPRKAFAVVRLSSSVSVPRAIAQRTREVTIHTGRCRCSIRVPSRRHDVLGQRVQGDAGLHQ